jgi:hypothetical protein
VKIWVLASCLVALPAFAEDGVMVHFTITKTAGDTVSTYTNGVLMRLTESTRQIIPGYYEMRLQSRQLADDAVALTVTLKDISGHKPRYAGSNAATLKVGDSGTLVMQTLPTEAARYEVLLDTSYGRLPETTR